jgi:hypothetical protein
MKKRSSKEIDKEMEAERATIRRMQTTLDRAKRERVEAEAARDAFAYSAIANEDKGAQKRLDEAENAMLKAERRMQSIETAIAQGTAKFAALEHEWKQALRRELLERWQGLAKQRIAIAPNFDRIIDELAAAIAQFNEITEAMRPMQQELNVGKKLHDDNVLNWLRARLFPITGELVIAKTFRYVSDRKNFSELETICFEQLLALEDVPGDSGSGPEAERGNGEDHAEAASAEQANEEVETSA